MTAPIHLWQRVGAWATMPADFDRVELPPLLERAHFGWIAFQIRNEGHDHDVVAELEPGTGWRTDVERGGKIGIVGWSVLGTDPLADADADARSVQRFRLAGWIADAEQHHHRGWGGDPARSSVYARRLRELLGPAFPLGFSTFGCAAGTNLLFHVNSAGGAPPQPPMNGKAFFENGFWLMPQAYPNQFGQTAESYSPELCIAHAAMAGWPLDRVALTLGIYDAASPPGLGRLALAWYRDRMLGKGTVGFNVYFASNMRTTPTDFDTCRDMVAVQKLAYKEQVNEPAVPPTPQPTGATETRASMLERADAMVAEWRRQGKTETAIERQRIAHAGGALRSTDAVWLERRDPLRLILRMSPEDWASKKAAIIEAIGPE